MTPDDDDDIPDDAEEEGRDHPGHREVKVTEEVDPDPGEAPQSDLLEDADHRVGLLPGRQGGGVPLLVSLHDVTHCHYSDGCHWVTMASGLSLCLSLHLLWLAGRAV